MPISTRRDSGRLDNGSRLLGYCALVLVNGVPVSTVDLKPLLDYWDDQSDHDPRTLQAFDTDKK